MQCGHANNESVDILGDFLPALDQDISEHLDSMQLFLTALDALKHSVPKLLHWI